MKLPKKFFLNFSILVISLFTLLLSLEIFLRISGWGHPRIDTFDGVILKHKPYATWVNRKENKNIVRLNNLGFHDKNRQFKNRKYRILFLGDSFVEGVQVPTEALFTSILENKFEQKQQSIEVLNGGMSGTGTLLSLSFVGSLL